VLIYHRVLDQPDSLFPEIPDRERFTREMQWIRDWCNVLPLEEAVERLQKASLPPRAASITFDDGYADNLTIAAPILQRLSLPATVFVTSGTLNGGCMWNDMVIEALRRTKKVRIVMADLGMAPMSLQDAVARRTQIDDLLGAIKRLPDSQRQAIVGRLMQEAEADLPDDLMMSYEQVRKLACAGFGIGAHTISHPILACVDDARARQEICQSRDDLEQICGQRVTLFAYPNGVPQLDYFGRHVQMVRQAGYAAAFSTAAGACHAHGDRYQLPRFTPWDRSRTRFGLRLAKNLVTTIRAVDEKKISDPIC